MRGPFPLDQPPAEHEAPRAVKARRNFDLARETYREHEAACDICRFDVKQNAGTRDCLREQKLLAVWHLTHTRLIAARKRAS